jgi:hypothetical protein
MSSEEEQPADPADHEADQNAVLEDRRLVDRCVRGEVPAWEELYAQCHPTLLVSIELMLGAGGTDAEMVEEIAARVWYAMVADDGKLLDRYDPRRGARLVTFFRAVAKDKIRHHFRAERRRLRHELKAYRESARRRTANADEGALALQEFLSTLSPYERSFCGEHLLREMADCGGGSRQTWQSASIWQLTCRIRQKLIAFLGAEP